jgi:hypothetical protein
MQYALETQTLTLQPAELFDPEVYPQDFAQSIAVHELARPKNGSDEVIFSDQIYGGGALALFALHEKVGDRTWRALMKEWAQRYEGQSVSTDDFIAFVDRNVHRRPCATSSAEADGGPPSRAALRSSQRLVVDLEEVLHLGLPPVVHERHVVGVLVVRLVGVRSRELHRAAEAEGVLRAHLAQQLVRLDAGDVSQRGLRRQEVALLLGARLVDEGEGHGVPDSAGGQGRHRREARPSR